VRERKRENARGRDSGRKNRLDIEREREREEREEGGKQRGCVFCVGVGERGWRKGKSACVCVWRILNGCVGGEDTAHLAGRMVLLIARKRFRVKKDFFVTP